MTFLLDTPTFMWLLRAPENLPSPVRVIAAEPSNALVLSIVTPWEMAVKANLGKLDAGGILDNFERLVAPAGYSILETTTWHVIRGGRLPLHHKDPFDRLLAAQALELQLPLLSGNEAFDWYGVHRIWD